MKDQLLRATFTGFISVIFKDLFDFLYMRLGYQGTVMATVAAGAFLGKNEIGSPLSLFIGYCAHFLVGGILGAIFLCILYYSGSDYSIIKGIVFGAIAWLILPGMLLTLGISRNVPSDVSTYVMLLIDHLIFGLSLGIIFPRFVLIGYKKEMF